MHNNGFEKVTELIRMSNLERFKANKKTGIIWAKWRDIQMKAVQQLNSFNLKPVSRVSWAHILLFDCKQ